MNVLEAHCQDMSQLHIEGRMILTWVPNKWGITFGLNNSVQVKGQWADVNAVMNIWC